jgi:hypothetical protein
MFFLLLQIYSLSIFIAKYYQDKHVKEDEMGGM